MPGKTAAAAFWFCEAGGAKYVEMRDSDFKSLYFTQLAPAIEERRPIGLSCVFNPEHVCVKRDI